LMTESAQVLRDSLSAINVINMRVA
jgi:hypothetical protein